MPGLQWVRLDTGFHADDKIMRLKVQRDGWRAIVSYVQSLGWAGGHGTDGFIPVHVLPLLDATDRVTQLLVEGRLWHPDRCDGDDGFRIHNFTAYQQLAAVTGMKERAARVRGIKGACVRYHGEACGCWRRRVDDL